MGLSGLSGLSGLGYGGAGASGPGVNIITEAGTDVLLTEDSIKITTENSNDGGNLVTLFVDPAVDADTSSVTQLAFGFDQLVRNYTDITCTLQRSSDSAQATFGPGASGEFDLAGVLAWAGSSDVTVVDLVDQKGSGKRLTAVGTIYLVQSSSVTRFGTLWNSSTGQLTRSTTQGAVGVSITGGSYFALSNSGITASSGLEVHMLKSSNARKTSSVPPSTEPAGLGANNTAECYFSYGLSTTNYFALSTGGGNFTHRVRRVGTGVSGTDQSLTTSLPAIKAKAQQITSTRLDDTVLCHYTHGSRLLSTTPSAGNVTANATFSNGTFRVGQHYPGLTTANGNFLFGGVIVTQSLTDLQRFGIQARLTAQANQHLVMSRADLIALFDEIVDFRDIDTGTGLVAGKNGNLTLQVNLATTQYSQTPDWTLENAIPHWGISGLKSNDESNYATTFTATDNYFSDVDPRTGGTIVILGYRDVGGHLTEWLMSGTSDHTSSPPTMNSYSQNFAFGVGFHHSQPNFYRRVAATKDTNDLTGHEGWADLDGGRISQSMLKYMFNLANGDWVSPKTTAADVTVNNIAFGTNFIPSGTSLTTAGVAAVSTVKPPTPENDAFDTSGIKFPFDDSFLQFHAVTFQASADYDPAASQAAREPYMRTATNYSYVASMVGSPVGHMDCSVAREIGNGAVVHSDPAAKIQSAGYLNNLEGTRLWFGFCKTVLTMEQVQQLNINLYRLFTDGYS